MTQGFVVLNLIGKDFQGIEKINIEIFANKKNLANKLTQKKISLHDLPTKIRPAFNNVKPKDWCFVFD